jgi:hypothetical protein
MTKKEISGCRASKPLGGGAECMEALPTLILIILPVAFTL